MQQRYDAVIVGGGPAGVSCAVWLARLGLSPLLIEAGERLGGLAAANPFVDHWLAALPGATGLQIADNLAQSAQAAGVPVRLRAPAVQVRAEAKGFAVMLAAQDRTGGKAILPAPDQTARGRALVIASGVRARNLAGHAPQARWPGVLVGPGSTIVAQDYTGLSVAVLGGGDNAFENFVYVRGRGARTVHLYARTVRAQAQWVARATSADEAGVHRGDYAVDPAARTVNGHRYDLILVFYGWEPQASFADGLNLARDERGYIRTGAATAQASLPGVYAIGEVANRMHPCVLTAMADGVVAAKAIQRSLGL